MAPVIHGRVTPLDREGRWLARGIYLQVAEGLIPIGAEVRPNPSPGSEAADWPELPDEIDPGAIPPGGLSLALLRNLEWSDRDERNEAVVDRIHGDLGDLYEYGYEAEAVLEHLQRVTDIAVARGILRRGRRDLARSFFALVESSPDPYPGRTPPGRQQTLERVRRVFPDFTETELRATLQWARGHRPPLFSSFGERRAGGLLTALAQRILVLADPLDALPADARDEVLAQRAADLPEFER